MLVDNFSDLDKTLRGKNTGLVFTRVNALQIQQHIGLMEIRHCIVTGKMETQIPTAAATNFH